MGKFKGKRVLVTGGTGLVGRELVELLVEDGADVTSVSMDENNFNPEWKVEYINGDLREPQVCRDAVAGKDFVFHIAGIKGSPVVVKQYQSVFFNSFILMNTNMIQAMNNSEDMEFGLYTSTVGTYGPAEVFYENSLWDQNPSKNDWFAGWAKRMGEVAIDAYEEEFGVRKIAIMKPVNIYGKFDNFDLRTSTLVPSLTRKVQEAEGTVDIWGDGTTERDIIHARDVARAAMLLVEKKAQKTVNIGKGKGVQILKVIKTLIEVSGKDLEITHDMTKPRGDELRIADITRLNSFGFKPTVSLEEGLRETYEWYNDNYKNPYARFDPFVPIK